MEKYFTRPFSNWMIIGFFVFGLILGQINLPGIILDFLTYLFFAYFVLLYIFSVKLIPGYNKNELLYSENSASGYSHCHIFTKLGGGWGCVRLRLTRDLLIVSSWFPFSLLAPVFDMVHIIPYSAIKELNSKNILWKKGITITYRDNYQESVIFTVFPKNLNKFETVIKENIVRLKTADNLSLHRTAYSRR